jgi:replicative DNA helicase
VANRGPKREQTTAERLRQRRAQRPSRNGDGTGADDYAGDYAGDHVHGPLPGAASASDFEPGDAWEGPGSKATSKPQTDAGYRFAPLTSAELVCRAKPPEWLVRRQLVAGQPGVIGGPSKSLKTSLAVDLALSLGSGTPFLGTFATYQRTRTVLMSAESGDWTLLETARRVSDVKGVRLEDADCLWDFTLPQLASPLHMDELCRGLERFAVKVAIIDPLYLCLLAGRTDVKASNLFEVGPLLLAAARACLTVGCTPLFIHHTTKPSGRSHDPLDLGDLAFSGVQEFSRQWLLVNRREAFEQGSGIHRLWLSVGGSCGQSGLWALDVDEGSLGEDFAGRLWDVQVRTGHDEREGEGDKRLRAAEEKRSQARRADESRLLRALDQLDPEGNGAGLKRVRELAGLSGDAASGALTRLAAEGIVEEIKVEADIGSGATRKVQGLRRCRETDHRDHRD